MVLKRINLDLLLNNKKSKKLDGIGLTTISNISQSNEYNVDLLQQGIANESLIEPIPKYIQAGCERVISGENNSHIIFGRDRPASRLSGYGGVGDTQAGAIDIVVGLMGRHVKSHDDNNERIYVDKNFADDSARIYMSQKTNIDRNFNLVPGRVGTSDARSGIAMKADAIRIIGREGIKLVTKSDAYNSHGGNIDSVKGIDLIAGNDASDLQPIPKGSNLVDAMERIVEHVKNLTGIVETLLSIQMKMNTTLSAHTHIGNLGAPTSPSPEALVAGITATVSHVSQDLLQLPLHRTNLEMFKVNYLKPIGKKYINSRHNNTN